MSKKMCDICGQKINSNDIFCQKCGIPLASFKDNKKNKLLVKPGIGSNSIKSSQESVTVLKRLDVASKCVSAVAFLLNILLSCYFLINTNFFGILVCILLFFIVPFVSLPFIWMKLILENIIEINDKR